MRISAAILISACTWWLSACSPVAFAPCESFGDQACGVTAQGIRHFDNVLTVGQPQADILFIDDNSGSMSTEQAKMADKFPNFISSLGSIDYRISIITTDVSMSPSNPPSSANQNGALQDGNFITFGDGSSVLTPLASGIDALFKAAIQRPETLACESSDFSATSCPSPDERAIFAANLAVDRGQSTLFRPSSHLAMVILSDEDERSRSGEISGYALEGNDQPQSLIDNVKAKFGASKSLSVHAIIIEPGDSDCLSQQNSQTRVKGFEGKVYADLAQKTSGTIGSICANDYGQELGTIGSSIVDSVNSITLACRPESDVVAVIVEPEPAGLQVTVDPQGHRVQFSQNLPPGTTARVIYDCPES